MIQFHVSNGGSVTNEITIPAPDDWHAHYRDEPMLSDVAPFSATQFKRVVAMGNVPAITTVEKAIAYNLRTNAVTKPYGSHTLVSPKITDLTTPDLAQAFWEAGFPRLKFYPEGATTASSDGISNIAVLFPTFEVMQDRNMVLQIHGECPATWEWVDVSRREMMFLPLVQLVADNFPKLRIVLEHISTSAAVAFIEDAAETVGATVTIHHLLDTMNDVRGGLGDPHRMCKPEIKGRADRDALRMLVFYKKLRRVFFGSDSAPHRLGSKHSDQICSGVFSAPVLMPKLLDLFQRYSDGESLIDFTWAFGADFYGLPRNKEKLVLARDPWVVPDMLGEVRPYMAGQTIEWRVGGFV
ncbi:MAG: amidohydrolase family protein [Candidatus Doudnabacteria bacterium]